MQAEIDTPQVDYHRDYASVSRSMLSVLKESPRLYYERFIARTRQPDEPTPAMVRGTRFDVLVLDPDEFNRRYAVTSAFAPDGEKWDRRNTDHKAVWAYELLRIGDREAVTDSDLAELNAMRDGAMRNEKLRELIEAVGSVQHRIDWTDPTFGVQCRSLLDKRIGSADYILDLKTSADPSPEPFQRSVVTYGYHRQDAWYSDGYQITTERKPRFLFGVVGSKPPYDAAVYELDDEAKRIGRLENMTLLNRLMEFTNSGEWCSSWSKDVVKLPIPKWYDPNRSEVNE